MNVKPLTYESSDAYIQGLIMAVTAKENSPERQELEELIRTRGGLLIGAKALAHYVKPRFTQDTDYLVDGPTFRKVRQWFAKHASGLQYVDQAEAICCESLGIDVVDASTHPVLKEVVRHEKAIPSAEALAATKYCSLINPMRTRKDQDAVDFKALVCLQDFDTAKCLSFFVDRFEAMRPEIEQTIARLRRGDAAVTI